MLSGEYDYRAQVEILQGGYPGEDKGVTPEDNTWHTTSNPTGSATYTYYYTDSNTPDNWSGADKNAQSTQVLINATDTWNVSIDNDNNVTITVQTTIHYIERANKVGNPNYIGTWGRDIKLSRSKNGTVLWSVNNDDIGSNHPLSGPITLPPETFTLRPGESVARGSIYILNHTTGLPETELYTDEMWAGISFRNNLPADYRPGATWDGISWGSNNRAQGNCAVYNGSSYQECRTQDGHTGTGNPPLGHNGSWRNQYKINDQP